MLPVFDHTIEHPATRKGRRVPALKKYRITYKDGRTREVEANSTRTTKDFIYFQKDGNWIDQVAADSVESVGLAELPMASKPAPRSVGV